jgi:hypothetical protein
MKGIVVEIKNKNAVVLSDNGSIIKIIDENYQIGEEVEMKDSSKKVKVYLAAIVVGIMFVLTGVGGVYVYAKPYIYVSLDVNPSVEYSVNVFDRVIEANAVNEDGQDIIDNIDVKNETIDEAIKDTVSEITEQGYITEGETGGIVITTSSEDAEDAGAAEKLADELKADAEEVLDEKNLVADVETLSVGKERVQEAKELGTTPGKLNLVEKLQKSAANPEDISIEEWLNKPVKEIMKVTKANKEKQKVEEKETITNDTQEQDKAVQSETTNVPNEVQKAKTSSNESKSSNSSVNEKKDINTASSEKTENKVEEKNTENNSQSPKDNINKGTDKDNNKDKKNK